MNMTTGETYRRDDSGLTGLFNSMVGLTYASTIYALRFMFTNPMEMVDRARVSLDNVSKAIMDSTGGNGESKRTSRSAREALRDDVDAAQAAAARTVDDLTGSSTTSEADSETLSGRKR
jgi:hypothetical protein